MQTKLRLEDPAQFIPQGMMYLLRGKNNICRLALTLPDAVEPETLRAALEDVLARAPYFRTALVWEKDTPHLRDNGLPPVVVEVTPPPQGGNAAGIHVYGEGKPGDAPPQDDGLPLLGETGIRPRAIPEETNGYLFYFLCQGNTFCCDYFHFLTDGRGITRFLTQVALEYCNRRYSASLAGSELTGAPMYPMEEFARLYEKYRVDADLKRERPPRKAGQPRQWVFRTAKADWIAAAQRSGVKPFSYMLGALCRAARMCGGRDTVRYSYAVDARRAMGVPEALYNCVTIAQEDVQISPNGSVADCVQAIDAGVRANMQDETVRMLLAQATGWAYEVSRMKAPLRIKRRVFQMGEYAMGFQPDVWLSYLGDPLAGGPEELRGYIKDYLVWVPPDEGLLGVEAVSLHGVVTFCVQDKLEQLNFDEIFRSVLKQEGIRLLG